MFGLCECFKMGIKIGEKSIPRTPLSEDQFLFLNIKVSNFIYSHLKLPVLELKSKKTNIKFNAKISQDFIAFLSVDKYITRKQCLPLSILCLSVP